MTLQKRARTEMKNCPSKLRGRKKAKAEEQTENNDVDTDIDEQN